MAPTDAKPPDSKPSTGPPGPGASPKEFVPDFNLPVGRVDGAAQPVNQPKKQLQRHQIIYCSRTISQLSQVINELKSTAYDPRSVILASRDHTCVNP